MKKKGNLEPIGTTPQKPWNLLAMLDKKYAI
jgi:hypothetical protein